MTRVSSFGLNQTLLSDLQRNQQRVSDSQRQINSGKKTAEFRGLSRDVETLLGAKALRTRNFSHLDTIAEVKGKLEFNDLHLTSISDQLENLRLQVVSAIASEETAGLAEEVQQTFDSVVNSLNSKVSGIFIFAGTRIDTQPVSISSLAQLVAAPTTASIFQNAQTKPTARVDESILMEFGQLASDIGQPVLDAVRDIAIFDAGPSGPLNGKLTAAQKTFLESMLPKIDAAKQTLSGAITTNGIRQNRLEVIRDRVDSNVTFLSTFVSDIEDVDMAEAILNLRADQSALQASFSALGSLFKVSLLDFL